MTRTRRAIVAVSHRRDEHARPVLDALRRRGERAVLVDLADFPARARVAAGFGGGGEAILELPRERLAAADIRAVWWRRPEPPAPDPALAPAAAAFAARQTGAAVAGFWASLDVAWVNEPWKDEVASHRIRHLAAAERAGLAVPATLVTNDPARAGDFIAARGAGAVHKALDGGPKDWRPTAVVGEDDVERLPSLRLAPVVLQEYVDGVDVRVTVVGDDAFAAEIDARRTWSPQDFRPAFDEAAVAACELPRDVRAALHALVRDLGLRYAAIDLRRREDGTHLFLDLNPAGQWLFVEERTGQPITEAVAALLAAAA